MNKPKIKDRIVIWNGCFKGRTGEITKAFDKNSFMVKIDGCDPPRQPVYEIDELYFQSSPEGYNQACFQ